MIGIKHATKFRGRSFFPAHLAHCGRSGSNAPAKKGSLRSVLKRGNLHKHLQSLIPNRTTCTCALPAALTRWGYLRPWLHDKPLDNVRRPHELNARKLTVPTEVKGFVFFFRF